MVSSSTIYQMCDVGKSCKLSDFCFLVCEKGMTIHTLHDGIED